MTVDIITLPIEVNGNDAATVFSFAPLKIFTEEDLKVVFRDTDDSLTEVFLGTGADEYSVQATFPGDRSVTGSIIYPADQVTPIATGTKLFISPDLDYIQELAVENQGGYNPALQESAFDKLAILCNQLKEELFRAVKAPFGGTDTGDSLWTQFQADVIQVAADAAQVAADVIASAISAAAALVSENNSATSESNASTSASEAAASAGALAFKHTFDDSIVMGDPGAGLVRFNNATIANVTAMAFDATTADSGNPDISDFIATWADSTNPTVKGHLTVRKSGTPATFATFSISAVTDNTGWLQVTVAYVDGNGALTDADTLLVSFIRTGNIGSMSPSSVDTLTNKTINDASNTVHADATHLQVRNISGSTITKGSVVYSSGYNAGQDLPEVALADADDGAKMPAIGITDEDIPNNANGHVLVSGVVTGINTSSFSVTDELYIDTTAGALTNVRPTAVGTDVQKIAKVLRSHASLGVLLVQGAGRANALPNGDGSLTLSVGLTLGGYLACKDVGELTIAAGVITITGTSHTIDTQGDDASDELDTINGGADGKIIIIRPEDGTHTVVLKHGTGNILTADGLDITLDTAEKSVILQYDLALSKWLVLSSPGVAGLNNVVEDTSPQLGGFLDPNGKYIGWAKGGDIASASPLVIDTDGNMFDVTGTTNFTVMTVAVNRNFTLQFDGIITVTHGASIILPAGANFTTAAGDIFECQSIAANVVLVTGITKADGTAVVAGGGATKEFFLPFVKHSVDAETYTVVVGSYIMAVMDSTDEVYALGFVPNDFTSLIAATVLLRGSNATEQIDAKVDHGAVGEQYNANSDSALNVSSGGSVTSGELHELDISGAFTAIVAGDYMGINIEGDSTDSKFVGVRFKYT